MNDNRNLETESTGHVRTQKSRSLFLSNTAGKTACWRRGIKDERKMEAKFNNHLGSVTWSQRWRNEKDVPAG